MRFPSFAVVAVTVPILLGGGAALAQDAGYLPQKGHEVVVYTHHFKAENFAAGAKLVEEGFTSAQTAMGQTRHNYFLVNPATYDVVVVSFFDADESVDDWHDYVGRQDVLKQLEPMRRSPLELERYTIDAISTTE